MKLEIRKMYMYIARIINKKILKSFLPFSVWWQDFVWSLVLNILNEASTKIALLNAA